MGLFDKIKSGATKYLKWHQKMAPFTGAILGGAAGGPGGAAAGGQFGTMISNWGKDPSRDAALERNHWFQENRKMQENFAKNSIQWKVEDAKKAGIHPLAALGAQTHSASPAFIDGNAGLQNNAADLSSMGQNVSRAIMSGQTKYEKEMQEIQLSNAKIDNEMKQLELTNAYRSSSQSAGKGMPDQIQHNPAEVTSHVKNNPHVQAGTVPQTTYYRNKDGSLTPIPAKQAKEGMEDQWMAESTWTGKNYVSPYFGGMDNKPPKSMLTKKQRKQGYKDFEWNVWTVSWEPVKHKARSPWKQYIDWSNKKFFRRK